MHDWQKDKILSHLCTFGIGGPAKYYVEVRSIDSLRETLLYCHTHAIPYFVLGKGSNCLFDDQGFNGLVIHNKIDFIQQPAPCQFHVGAGYSFSLLGTHTARKHLTGLEFASGIPGSVGGAVYMNAGANGQETCNALFSVEFLHLTGETTLYRREELLFSYRTSPFQKMQGAIISATFQLQESACARDKQIELISYRQRTQPYGEKSAGCVFRNPLAGHAGALIEKSGLKGTTIGDAQVSQIHGNFFVNKGRASAKDVRDLIALVQEKVKAFSGVDLHSEVLYIPFDTKI